MSCLGLAVSEVSGPGTPPPQTSGGLHSQPPMSPPRHLDMQSQGRINFLKMHSFSTIFRLLKLSHEPLYTQGGREH